MPIQLGNIENCIFHLGQETIFHEGIYSIAPLQLRSRNAISNTAQMHSDDRVTLPPGQKQTLDAIVRHHLL